MSYQAIVATPIGKVGLRLSSKGISKLDFLPINAVTICSFDALVQKAVAEITAYFIDPQHLFSALLDLNLTPFQEKVLTRLQKIPVGQVCTYGQIAEEVGGSARAVGNACRHNPAPIFIPGV